MFPHRFVFSGTCRNDDFNRAKGVDVLIGMAFNSAFVPLLKCVYEVSYFVKKDDGEITFSRTEEWRRKLSAPFADIFVTLTPLLGAFLFPEGYQPSEATGRSARRTLLIVSTCSSMFDALFVCVSVCVTVCAFPRVCVHTGRVCAAGAARTLGSRPSWLGTGPSCGGPSSPCVGSRSSSANWGARSATP